MHIIIWSLRTLAVKLFERTVANPVGKNSQRPVHRFSMRVLLLAVALFACLFAYLSYYRSARVTVDYAFWTVEAETLDAIPLQFHSVQGSPYRWVHLSVDNAAQLCEASSSDELLHKQVTIGSWPMQAETTTSTRSVFLDVEDPKQGDHPAQYPAFNIAIFGGFLGVRRAGTTLQFRVEGGVTYDRTENRMVGGRKTISRDRVSGEIFYEGQAPEHALIFVAPLDEHSYHVVLFRLKE